MSVMAAGSVPPALEASQPVKSALRRLEAARGRLEAARANYDDTRRQTVADLVAAGLSYSQIGTLIDVSKARVAQILAGE